MGWHETPWTPPNLSYFFVKISLSHFSYLSHLKTTVSRRHSCKSRPSKPFKHFPDRTQGCLMFCTQQQIIYIPHVILFVSAVLWHHFTGPRLSRGWYPAGRARLIRQREDDAYVLGEPHHRVVSLQMCWQGLCSKPATGAQPPCPHHTQLPSLYLWFPNRYNISKQSLGIFLLLLSILFLFFPYGQSCR